MKTQCKKSWSNQQRK